MKHRIEVRVDGDHSVDPSYIVHYRVTEQSGRPLSDGIVQYHRLAADNDIPINKNIPPAAREEVRQRVIGAVTEYISRRL